MMSRLFDEFSRTQSGLPSYVHREKSFEALHATAAGGVPQVLNGAIACMFSYAMKHRSLSVLFRAQFWWLRMGDAFSVHHQCPDEG
jgi:hypothetical protein